MPQNISSSSSSIVKYLYITGSFFSIIQLLPINKLISLIPQRIILIEPISL